MECGCEIRYGDSREPEGGLHDDVISFCPMHAAADAMLAKLLEINEELQDRYDYSEDSDGKDESPWNGAGNLIHEIKALTDPLAK